jgi:hypothetical protein
MFELARDFTKFNTEFEVLGGYISPVSDVSRLGGHIPERFMSYGFAPKALSKEHGSTHESRHNSISCLKQLLILGLFRPTRKLVSHPQRIGMYCVCPLSKFQLMHSGFECASSQLIRRRVCIDIYCLVKQLLSPKLSRLVNGGPLGSCTTRYVFHRC